MTVAYPDALYFLGISLAFIVSLLLFNSPLGTKGTNRLLGTVFFGMAWFNMVILLVFSGLFLKVYWLAGWGIPLYYLVYPCAYLYVRQVQRGENALTRRDLWHFLPFLVAFADLLPFNLGFYKEKHIFAHNILTDLNQIYRQDVSFVLPLHLHFYLRPAVALTYLVFQWRQLFRGRGRASRRMFQWLAVFTSFLTLFLVLLCGLRAAAEIQGSGLYLFHNFEGTLLIIYVCFLLVSVALLFYPEALYGISSSNEVTGTSTERPVNAGTAGNPAPLPTQGSLGAGALSPMPGLNTRNIPQADQYLEMFETYMKDNLPYLHSKWTLQDMAMATRIPLHHLSPLINQHYKMRYTDLMNQYRVERAKDLIAEGAWQQLSLEGVGKQSGFSNRTNFFLVFKKMTGMSPSEYLQREKALKFPGI